MNYRVIEATTGFNWGKFLLCQFTEKEFHFKSQVDGDNPFSRWTPQHILVFDLATGEGALFRPGGSAEHDLNQKHQIWVCPLYEPFLKWLYELPQPIDIMALPPLATFSIDEAPPALHGYRRTRRIT